MFWFHTRVRVQPQHSLCGHSHVSWNAQARVTFVCLTEPKMPAAMPKCCSSGLASCPSKKHPCNWQNVLLCLFFFFVRFLNCLDLLSNPVLQWIFIESIYEAVHGIKDGKSGCKLLLLVLFIIISIIIIAIIFKNENPMVCLLALWVYKCFFP